MRFNTYVMKCGSDLILYRRILVCIIGFQGLPSLYYTQIHRHDAFIKVKIKKIAHTERRYVEFYSTGVNLFCSIFSNETVNVPTKLYHVKFILFY